MHKKWSSHVRRSSKCEDNLLEAELHESTRDGTGILAFFSRASSFIALHQDAVKKGLYFLLNSTVKWSITQKNYWSTLLLSTYNLREDLAKRLFCIHLKSFDRPWRRKKLLNHVRIPRSFNFAVSLLKSATSWACVVYGKNWAEFAQIHVRCRTCNK